MIDFIDTHEMCIRDRSTKMLFPMLLLMLPSIIMLMLAPMVLQLGEFF